MLLWESGLLSTIIWIRIVIDLKEANVQKIYTSEKSTKFSFFSDFPKFTSMVANVSVREARKGIIIYGIRAHKDSANLYTTKKTETNEERLVDRLRRFYEACTTITSNIVNLLLLLAVSRLSSSSTLSNNAS